VYAATGMPYAGWGTPGVTNPVQLNGSTLRSGATNGSLLYFATAPTVGNGDVYALNPLTGAIVWQLSSSAGYQGVNNVGRRAGIERIFNSRLSVLKTRPSLSFPTAWPTTVRLSGRRVLSPECQHRRAQVVCRRCGDGGRGLYGRYQRGSELIHVLGRARWTPYQVPGDYMVFNRKFGTNELGIQNTGGYHTWLSCEVDVPDWLFLSGTQGVFRVYNADDGSELFQRRVDYGPTAFTRFVGSASAPDWVVVTARFGAVHGLFKVAPIVPVWNCSITLLPRLCRSVPRPALW